MNAEQLSLDAPAGLARSTDGDTSKSAAARITGRTERLILQHMRSWTRALGRCGWTADELCIELPDIYEPTVVSAISRLKNRKLIEPTGTTRPSRRGSAQTVYRLSTERAAT